MITPTSAVRSTRYDRQGREFREEAADHQRDVRVLPRNRATYAEFHRVGRTAAREPDGERADAERAPACVVEDVRAAPLATHTHLRALGHGPTRASEGRAETIGGDVERELAAREREGRVALGAPDEAHGEAIHEASHGLERGLGVREIGRSRGLDLPRTVFGTRCRSLAHDARRWRRCLFLGLGIRDR